MLMNTETVAERSATAVVLAEEPTVAPSDGVLQGWADQITQASGQAVEAILHIGRVLLAAKQALPHGQWERLFKGHPLAVAQPVPFSVATAKMHMKIARHPVLSNSNHGNCLPPSWRTLYVLTFVPEATLEGLMKAMSPELTRTQAHTLVYACRRYTNVEAAVERGILAYKKKLQSHEADACLCRCSCGHVHPDQRVKRQLAEIYEP